MLRQRGIVQTKIAFGDFSLLKRWIDCASEFGIELRMQQSLGKGKNSADIKLTIAAMDILHHGSVDAIALVSNDRDFSPLAFRLREAGIQVIGFSHREPGSDFRAACSDYVVVAPTAATHSNKPLRSEPILSADEIETLTLLATAACADGPINPVDLTKAIIAATPDLATKLSGKGKFLKTLVKHDIVVRVGSGAELRVRAG